MEGLIESIHLLPPVKFSYGKFISKPPMEVTSPAKQEKAAITKLLQSDSSNVSNLKKMVWKLQEENDQLRESLCVLVQAIEEEPSPLIKKINESSVEHISVSIKEFAAKARQKQWALENKLKKNECQLRTLAIDAKTREQLWIKDITEVNKELDKYRQEFETVRTRMTTMENKYDFSLREKNDIIQKLCGQLQKCSDELKNSTRELLDQNKKRVTESLANTRRLLSEVDQAQTLSRSDKSDLEYKSYIASLQSTMGGITK